MAADAAPMKARGGEVPSVQEARRFWQQQQHRARWADLEDDEPETTTSPRTEVTQLKAVVADLVNRIHNLETAAARNVGIGVACGAPEMCDAAVQTEQTGVATSSDVDMHVMAPDPTMLAGPPNVFAKDVDNAEVQADSGYSDRITRQDSASDADAAAGDQQSCDPVHGCDASCGVDAQEHPHRYRPDVDSQSVEGVSLPELAEQCSPPGRRRRRKVKAKHSPSADVEEKQPTTQPSERVEEPQVSDHALIAMGALDQLREALASAENGDFGQMLTAFARVLTLGEELPDDQLYTEELHKERGGWRASVRLASGLQITGGVRASQSAAVDDAHEESFGYIGKFIKKLAEASARRGERANAPRRGAEAP